VIQNLGVASNEELPRDGMEVALVRIDLQHRQFVFSGANRPGLFFESHEQWSELPYTRRPIGYNPFAAPDAQNAQFDSVTKNYQAGQSLYLFSDGVTDQFGSQNSRKLTRRAFIEIVSSFQLDTMQTQAEEIEGFLNAWKGNLQQTDDICVIGIQF
jgi:serine phosphatase RsbU (regulator of sigma subunit)